MESIEIAGIEETPLRRIRRNQLARLKKARCQYWAGRALTTKRMSGMVCQTPAICSCWACKNHKEQSRQSKRLIDIEKSLKA